MGNDRGLDKPIGLMPSKPPVVRRRLGRHLDIGDLGDPLLMLHPFEGSSQGDQLAKDRAILDRLAAACLGGSYFIAFNRPPAPIKPDPLLGQMVGL
jgi:hypothetical protein